MHELELNDATAVEGLIELCTKKIEDRESRSNIIDLILKAKKTKKMVLSLDMLGINGDYETISLAGFAKRLAKLSGDGEVRQVNARLKTSSMGSRAKTLKQGSLTQELPGSIVSAFKT